MKNKLVKQKVIINDKEQEGYFFTDDELNEFVKDAYPTGEFWKEYWYKQWQQQKQVPTTDDDIKKMTDKILVVAIALIIYFLTIKETLQQSSVDDKKE